MAVKKTTKTAAKYEKAESEFSKEQLLAADRFRTRRDILTALLAPDKTYTVGAAEQMIENYLKGQVK